MNNFFENIWCERHNSQRNRFVCAQGDSLTILRKTNQRFDFQTGLQIITVYVS